MKPRKRILFSVLLFAAMLLVFKADVLLTRCPAISCSPPTGCVGGCYSLLNAWPFISITLLGIVLPPALFRVYREVW